MPIRYLLSPCPVKSKSDGQIHIVTARKLAALYGVSMSECLVMPAWNDRSKRAEQLARDLLERAKAENLTILHPRYDGDYILPKGVTVKSPYAHVFTALADGETEFQLHTAIGEWTNITIGQLFCTLQDFLCRPEHLRVAPKTITINKHVVRKPLEELPDAGVTVWWPSFGFAASPNNTESEQVRSKNDVLTTLLKQGLLHLTEGDASAHAKALISFTEVKS